MTGTAIATLEDAVRTFLDELSPQVEAIAATVAGIDAAKLRDDVVIEAYNLSCAFVDSDGLHTDDELWALIGVFGERIPAGHLGRSTPPVIRSAGLLNGRRAYLETPSALLDVLTSADAQDGARRTDTYARHASLIGYAIAAVDLLPSRTELAAIDRFRTMVARAVGRAPRAPAPSEGPLPDRPATAGVPASATAPPDSDAARDLSPPQPLDELLAELDGLIGLDGVKREVRLVANLLRVQQIRRQRHLPVLDQSRHLIFTGNPGTGKTTVARLLAQIYRTLGVVERGHLVETDRSSLVAGFVGQTAGRVVAAFDRADQGLLLVDEAYSLVRGGEHDFGREAIDTIVRLVEDRRGRLVVILAGYPEEMAELVDANPGMRSRFPKTIHFPDYTNGELLAIFESLSAGGRYHLDGDARGLVLAYMAHQPRDRGFGNGRLVRNLFEACVANQATRLVAIDSPTDEQLTTLTGPDIPAPTGDSGAEDPGRRGGPDGTGVPGRMAQAGHPRGSAAQHPQHHRSPDGPAK